MDTSIEIIKLVIKLESGSILMSKSIVNDTRSICDTCHWCVTRLLKRAVLPVDTTIKEGLDTLFNIKKYKTLFSKPLNIFGYRGIATVIEIPSFSKLMALENTAIFHVSPKTLNEIAINEEAKLSTSAIHVIRDTEIRKILGLS